MSIEKRIEKLEKHTEAIETDGPPITIIFVLPDGTKIAPGRLIEVQCQKRQQYSQEERDRGDEGLH